jgi:hypothetical protein
LPDFVEEAKVLSWALEPRKEEEEEEEEEEEKSYLHCYF